MGIDSEHVKLGRYVAIATRKSFLTEMNIKGRREFENNSLSSALLIECSSHIGPLYSAIE